MTRANLAAYSISDTLGVPAPEMTFPHNVLQIRHGRSGFTYTYDCVRALRAVAGVHSETAIEGLVVRPEAEMSQCAHSGDRKNQKAGIRGAIKVAYAKEWGKKR